VPTPETGCIVNVTAVWIITLVISVNDIRFNIMDGYWFIEDDLTLSLNEGHAT